MVSLWELFRFFSFPIADLSFPLLLFTKIIEYPDNFYTSAIFDVSLRSIDVLLCPNIFATDEVEISVEMDAVKHTVQNTCGSHCSIVDTTYVNT